MGKKLSLLLISASAVLFLLAFSYQQSNAIGNIEHVYDEPAYSCVNEPPKTLPKNKTRQDYTDRPEGWPTANNRGSIWVMDSPDGISDPGHKFASCINYCEGYYAARFDKYLKTPWGQEQSFQSEAECKTALAKFITPTPTQTVVVPTIQQPGNGGGGQPDPNVTVDPASPNSYCNSVSFPSPPFCRINACSWVTVGDKNYDEGKNPVCSPKIVEEGEKPGGTEITITENTNRIKVIFEGIPKNAPNDEGYEYYACLRTDYKLCGVKDLIKIDKLNAKADETPKNSGVNQIIFPELCGDGESKMKGGGKCTDTSYFHQGYSYRISLYGGKDTQLLLNSAGFYTSHFYPEPKLNIDENSKPQKITVSLTGTKFLNGKNYDKYNNYVVSLEKRGTPKASSSQCIISSKDGNDTKTFTPDSPNSDRKPIPEFAAPDGNKFEDGYYIIYVSEGYETTNFTDAICERQKNGFVYWAIPIEVANGKIIKSAFIKDPSGVENDRANRAFPAPPTCASYDSSGNCSAVMTGIGLIDTLPGGFVGRIFALVLSIAGIACFGIFIQAGYKLMTSAGNKEKVGQAREQITSAIIGLIFIILSLAILQFIGIDILRIPGFIR